MPFHLFQDNHAGFYMYITPNHQSWLLTERQRQGEVARGWQNELLSSYFGDFFLRKNKSPKKVKRHIVLMSFQPYLQKKIFSQCLNNDCDTKSTYCKYLKHLVKESCSSLNAEVGL